MMLSTGMTYLLPILFVAAMAESTENKSAENEVGEPAINPLYRILVRLQNAYKTEDFCENNPVIQTECEACTLLGLHSTSRECCGDIAAFDICHGMLAQFIADLKGIQVPEQRQRLDLSALFEPEEEDSSSEVKGYNNLKKRYGTVFSKWNWSPSWRRDKSKRYGTVFGLPLSSGRKPWWRRS